MNTRIQAVGLCLAFAATAAASDREELGSLIIQPLADAGPGVWWITDKDPVWANSLLVETMDSTLVLCDTPMTEAATQTLLAWAERRFGPRRWIVVNGHFHPDCMAGNAAMIDAGATVVASTHTAALIDSRARRFLDDLARDHAGDAALETAFRETRVAGPTSRFDPERPFVLPVTGERVVVSFPGAAHSPDNVVTFFADRGVLFAGCLCFSARRDRPGFVGDANLIEWPATIERVKALGARVVVPGHGAPGGAELLDHTTAALRRHAEAAGASR